MAITRLAVAVVGMLALAGCTTSTVGGQPSSHPVLRLRPVLADPATGQPLMTPAQQPGAKGDPALRQDPAVATDPAKQQAAFDAADCSAADPLHAKDDPAKPLVTCDKDGRMKYALGPSFLDAGGAKTWADYTGANVGGFVAVLVDGQVRSAPKINQQIVGDTEISGSFTEKDAKDLAAALTR